MKRSERDNGNFRRVALLVGVLICLGLVVQGIFGTDGLLTLRQKRREFNSLTHQIQQLKKGNQRLQHQVQGLRSNPQTIGRYAREELHMARPGEIIYVLPRPKPNPNRAAAANQPPKR
ncbi:MAG: FtsB family cell division protein [Terriglobia bacterium]